jgi:anti-sigma factor RsiW
MAEHVLEWLNAYLDGELSGWRRERVENHLAGCPACQAELAALRRLSQVVQEALQEAPLPQGLPTAERFSAQLMLRLPRQQAQPTRHNRQELAWWLAPAALLFTWAFVQAIFLLSTGVWTAGQVGLLGEAAAWLMPDTQGASTVMGAFQWLGAQPGSTAQQVAAISEGIGWNTLVQLLVEAALGLLYLGWLAAWWLRRQQSGAVVIPAVNHTNGN